MSGAVRTLFGMPSDLVRYAFSMPSTSFDTRSACVRTLFSGPYPTVNRAFSMGWARVGEKKQRLRARAPEKRRSPTAPAAGARRCGRFLRAPNVHRIHGREDTPGFGFRKENARKTRRLPGCRACATVSAPRLSPPGARTALGRAPGADAAASPFRPGPRV